jgi:transcriptional regulator with XRE-family HTH domain
MSFRAWRERQLLSQERIAEMSGLSLRTVQRLEAGYRVSYASLRALAVAFRIDVDSLERELYAVNKSADDDYVEVPRWVRLMSDRLHFGGQRMSRRDFRIVELFCIACAVIVFALSFLIPEHPRAQLVRTCAFGAALSGYFVAANIRILDRYKLWPGAQNSPAATPRTWQSTAAEYAFYFGLGLFATLALYWLAF